MPLFSKNEASSVAIVALIMLGEMLLRGTHVRRPSFTNSASTAPLRSLTTECWKTRGSGPG